MNTSVHFEFLLRTNYAKTFFGVEKLLLNDFVQSVFTILLY